MVKAIKFVLTDAAIEASKIFRDLVRGKVGLTLLWTQFKPR